jgi:hypothetical protein
MLPDTFWPRVDKTDTCWNWTGADNGVGYGHLRFGRKDYYAHRLAYEDAYGAIPDGMVIDHLCRNRSCVRPDHLEAVTFRENLLRGTGTSAANARKTHCTRGHEYSAENTKTHGHSRQCRACVRSKYSEKVGRQIVHRSSADGRSHCGKGVVVSLTEEGVTCRRCLR